MNNYTTFRNHRLGISFLLDKKAILITGLLFVITACVLILSVGIGTLFITPLDVIKTLAGSGSDQHSLIINNFRLPRVITALFVGAFLAASGTILQSLIRNPLASPDVIGITGGASLAAVVFITLFQSASIQWLPFASFTGSMAACLLLYILAWKGGVTPLRLVLTGIGVGAGLTAFTTFLILKSPLHLTSKAMIWMTGSVYGSDWRNVRTLLVWALVLFPVALVFGRSANIQQLGDDVATGVGNHVQKHRLILLLLSAALAGCAVAIGGAIGFVALIAPHIARKLVSNSFGQLLPVSALCGSLMVMLADLIGRTAFSPLDIPVGIFTSAIGAPFFIYLLYKNRNA